MHAYLSVCVSACLSACMYIRVYKRLGHTQVCTCDVFIYSNTLAMCCTLVNSFCGVGDIEYDTATRHFSTVHANCQSDSGSCSCPSALLSLYTQAVIAKYQ